MYLICGFVIAFVFLWLSAKNETKANAAFMLAAGLRDESELVKRQRDFIRQMWAATTDDELYRLESLQSDYIRFRDRKQVFAVLTLLAIVFGALTQYLLVWR